MRFLFGFLAGIGFLLLAGLVVIWTGAYNVAASSGHAGIVRWAFDSTFHNSVEARADDSAITPEMIRSADLRSGFREFQEYCVHCHGAPGVQPHDWTSGMVPNPPELSTVAGEWTPQQIFWIVKNGVKMTGMPAFGDTESDETIRNIAVFVDRLEGMSPQAYAQLRSRWGGAEGAHSGGHSHGDEGH